MWNQRDRFLVGLFAVQLVGALIFGLVVASSLAEEPATPQIVAADGTVVESGDDVVGTTGSATGSTGATTGSDASSAPGTTGQAGTAVDDQGTTTSDGTASSGGATTGTTTSGSEGAAPATGGEGTRTGITDDTIKIGVLVTQTGAINFRSSAQATKAYIDELNERGGIHGRRVEMILRDDSLDKNKGTAAVEEMIQAGVFAFVAFNAPLSEQDVVPIIEKHQIPLIGAFAIPPTPYGYLFSAPYETYGRVGGDRLGREGVTTPGLIYISNQVESTDRIIVDSWKAGLAEHGIELSDDNVFGVDVTKTSYDDVVTQLRFNGVDGIGTILDATAMKRLQQSMNRAAFQPIHASSPFGGDPDVLQDPNVGSSFEGTFVLSDIDFLGSGSQEVQRYESETRRRFGNDAQVNWAGQYGWLGAKIFEDAMNRIGTDPTRERLLAMVNSFSNYATGMTAPLNITEDPQSHASNNTCMKVGKVVNGKVQQVADWTCPALTMSGGGVG